MVFSVRCATAEGLLFLLVSYSLKKDYTTFAVLFHEIFGLKVCDPTCGSGHLLVYAFDLLYAIYEEEGYDVAEIPEKILVNNLFGIEIDERAGELAAFALSMKARTRHSGFFRRAVSPNICVLQNITFEPQELNNLVALIGTELFEFGLHDTLTMFAEATSFGSLIRPEKTKVRQLEALLVSEVFSGQLLPSQTRQKIGQVVKQANLLCPNYPVVIAHPPTMPFMRFSERLAALASESYPESKSDLYSMFIERNADLALKNGIIGMVTSQSWMFLGTFEKFRSKLFSDQTVIALAHLGVGVSDGFMEELAHSALVLFSNSANPAYCGFYFNVKTDNPEVEKEIRLRDILKNQHEAKVFRVSIDDLKKIPGHPLTYWVSQHILKLYSTQKVLGEIVKPIRGLIKAENNRIIRYWFEIVFKTIGFGMQSVQHAMESESKWFPVNRGGQFRKWFGNNLHILNWFNDGEKIKVDVKKNSKEKNSIPSVLNLSNSELYFQKCITWNEISTTNSLGARYSHQGILFANKVLSVFPSEDQFALILGLLNSKIMDQFLGLNIPRFSYYLRDITSVPFADMTVEKKQISNHVNVLIGLAKNDCDAFEISWDFTTFPMLSDPLYAPTVAASFHNWQTQCTANIQRMQELETENNRLFIEAYGLQDELTPEVPEDKITLTRADRSEDTNWLVSYFLGVRMGRYSLDQPGLVYAQSGNQGFEVGNYKRFPADVNGMVPITEENWFSDDAANQFENFIGTVWPVVQLETNLDWIAKSLCEKTGEPSRASIRRYFSTQFFKHHLLTYKSTPIYWLFTSGKHRAFQCLVYLHRYHSGTLALMQTNYVIPLLGRISSRIDQLTTDIKATASTSLHKKLEKERDTLLQQQMEIQVFEEKLGQYAEMRIQLDLNDGVKVNYGKFGDLLAEVKVVTGARGKQ
ncbi:MAG: BREX-1 system adenine-specific DNA-methyltransferase PglX [Blastocatellia bacterium]|nr:BREX-1 system adenine-specific DNA-methyltransferase PglX [Blastocatellia bacterium]